jgi:ABC-type nitrate/sulfonate/bicarbonate transport system substrate-binding protein
MEIPKLLLKTKGVDTSRVNFVSVGGMSDRLKAVLAGKVDATMIDTLFATKALESPDFHIVASIAKEFPQIAYIYLVGAERVLREKRKEVELFTRYAIVQGSRLIMKNPDVAVAALHKRLPDLEPKFIRSIVDRLVETGVFGTDGGLERAVTEFTVNLGLETGTLKKRVTFEEVAETSFVDKVLAEEGRYGK